MKAIDIPAQRKLYPLKNQKCSAARLGLLCAVLVFSAVRNGSSQERSSKLEWFIEGGGSILNLGKQPEAVIILAAPGVASSTSGYLVSPNHFSSSGLFFTGVRYHLTAKNALEVSYSLSVGNYFQIEPAPGNMPVIQSRFERYSSSLNYVRYLPGRGKLQPFLTAGLGAIRSNSVVTGWDRYNLSGNFGLGTDFRINQRLAFRLEVRDYVDFLPSPLQRASHDLAPSGGLVFSSRTPTPVPAAFPQLEIFFEGGASVLSGGSGPSAQAFMLNSSGQFSTDPDIIRTNSFSKSGRLLSGLRVMFTNNNALELSYAGGPNRYYEEQQQKNAPSNVTPLLEQVTLDAEDYAVNYVRYFPRGKWLKPFITGGAGLAHFAAFAVPDVNNFGWNVGAGADVPLWSRLAGRIEIRDYMSRQPDLLTGIVHNIAPTAGLAYRFK